MALRSINIGSEEIDRAIPLLNKGFPAHGTAFWRGMLARIQQMHKQQSVTSHGELLLNDEQPVGVLLKIQHHAPNISKPIINLSSWYIAQEFRWYAPRMLMKATADKGSIYTDFSPSPDVYLLNEKLGFKTISSHRLLSPTPLAGLFPTSKAKVFSVQNFGAQNLSADMQRFLISHHADQSENLLVDDGQKLTSAIYQLRKMRGITRANLIYTDDLQSLQRHHARVARHLLGKGITILTMPAIDHHRPNGSFLQRAFKPIQVKGDWQTNMVDLTYSEAILLPYQI